MLAFCQLFSNNDQKYERNILFSLDRSVIKFSTKALQDPSKYLEVEENPKAVKEYVEQLIGRVRHSEESEVFTEEALVTALLTSLMDETRQSKGAFN